MLAFSQEQIRSPGQIWIQGGAEESRAMKQYSSFMCLKTRSAFPSAASSQGTQPKCSVLWASGPQGCLMLCCLHTSPSVHGELYTAWHGLWRWEQKAFKAHWLDGEEKPKGIELQLLPVQTSQGLQWQARSVMLVRWALLMSRWIPPATELLCTLVWKETGARLYRTLRLWIIFEICLFSIGRQLTSYVPKSSTGTSDLW